MAKVTTAVDVLLDTLQFREELEAVAERGWPWELSDDTMVALLEEHGSPGEALYALQLHAQRRVSAIESLERVEVAS